MFKPLIKIKNIFKKSKDINPPIGLLDDTFDNLNLFTQITKKYPTQSFIYINNLKELEDKNYDTLEYLKKCFDIYNSYGVKIVICLSFNIMINYKDLLESFNIKLYYLPNILIDYVNNRFEHKNICFISRDYILKENMFQKSFKYSHLYNISSDEACKLISNSKSKTEESFALVKNMMKTVIDKSIDVLVYTESLLCELKTELNEFLSFKDLVDLTDITCLKIKSKLSLSGKGKRIICSNISKKEFQDLTSFYKNDVLKKNYYKYVYLEIKSFETGDNNE